MRGRRKRLLLTAAQRLKLYCFFSSLCILVVTLVCASHLKTLLSDLAVTRISGTVNRLVALAVNDAVNSGDIRYENLITFEKDNNGKISALQSNIAEFNRLQAFITQDVLQRISDTGETTLAIPLGTLFGSALLAGRGPSIKVKMQTAGSCTAHFENRFSDAGINQTTHRILLFVDVSMSILLPGFRTHTKVSNSYAVAETVIVGAVPDSYTFFHSGNDVQEDAYEYSMNNG